MITLSLPYPPSANRLWRAVQGRNIKSREYRDWMIEAYASVLRSLGRPPHKILGPYRMTLVADRPDKRRRDLSNLLKATEDFLTYCGAIEDDSNATSILMQWSELTPAKPGAITVTIEGA